MTVWLSVMLAVAALAVWLTPIVSKQVVTFRDKTEQLSVRVSQQTAQDNFFLRWNPRYLVSSDPMIRQIDGFFEQNSETLRRVGLPTSRRLATTQYVEPYRKQLSDGVQSAFQGILGLLGTIGSNFMIYAFVPFFILMILLDLERFKERATAIIPPSIRSETVELLSDVFNLFIRYLRGMAITLMYYVIIAAVTLTVVGAPYSLLLAVLFAAIYLIPIIGGPINVAILILLTGSSGRTSNMYVGFDNSWYFALFCGVIYGIVFLLFDPLVTNRVVGNSVGLNPLLSFFCVLSAGALFGPLGMVFAFPAAGAIKIILDRLIEVTSKSQDLQLPSLPLRHRST